MGVRRVILKSGFNADDSVRNVFTIEDTGSDPPMADYVSWLLGFWHTGLLAEVSNTWASTSIVEEIPNGTGGWTYAREVPTIMVGAASNDLLPRQMAAVIIGLVPGRRRAKKYIAGICEDSQSDGILDVAATTALLVSALAWQNPSDVVPGAAWSSGVCKPDGTDFASLNAIRVDSIMGTQRRRKQGVGQ